MSRRHRRAKRARMQAILNLVSVYYVFNQFKFMILILNLLIHTITVLFTVLYSPPSAGYFCAHNLNIKRYGVRPFCLWGSSRFII